MSRHRTLSGLLRVLGRTLGVAHLELDDEGACALSVDDRIVVHIAAAEPAGTAMLYAPLGTIQASRKAELHQRMLSANFVAAAQNLALSLDGEGMPVLLSHARVENLSNADFEQLVTRFVEVADGWVMELQGPAAADAAEPVAVPFDRFASMRA